MTTNISNKLGKDVLPNFLLVEVLRRKIRRGEEPEIINQFFDLEKSINTSGEAQRKRLINQCQLLCDTAEDATISDHWREFCLNNICRPLAALSPLDSTQVDVTAMLKQIKQLQTPTVSNDPRKH